MSNLSKITLIVPTYNRQPFALRTMRYWSGKAITVHILDGSKKPIDRDTIELFNKNINYHHLPIPPADRLEAAIDFVKSDYTILGGDDDMFLPSGMGACVNELEKDKALVACMGRCIGFRADKQSIIGWPAALEMKNYSILHKDPITRMIAHMNPYTPSTIYSVVRTNVWKKSIQVLAQKDFKVKGLKELQFELSVCFHGKSRVINKLMWLRSSENVPIRKLETPQVAFIEWWKNKQSKTERETFLKLTSSILAGNEKKAVEFLSNGIKRAMDQYIKQYEKSNESVSQQNTIDKLIFNFVSRLMPLLVKNKIKRVIERIELMKTALSQIDSLITTSSKLKKQGVGVDYDDLYEIEHSITAFYKNCEALKNMNF